MLQFTILTKSPKNSRVEANLRQSYPVTSYRNLPNFHSLVHQQLPRNRVHLIKHQHPAKCLSIKPPCPPVRSLYRSPDLTAPAKVIYRTTHPHNHYLINKPFHPLSSNKSISYPNTTNQKSHHTNQLNLPNSLLNSLHLPHPLQPPQSPTTPPHPNPLFYNSSVLTPDRYSSKLQIPPILILVLSNRRNS